MREEVGGEKEGEKEGGGNGKVGREGRKKGVENGGGEERFIGGSRERG